MTLWSMFGAMSWQHCSCARFLCRNVALQGNLLPLAEAFVTVRSTVYFQLAGNISRFRIQRWRNCKWDIQRASGVLNTCSRPSHESFI